MDKIRCGLCGGAGCSNCAGEGWLIVAYAPDAASASWQPTYFRNGAQPGEVERVAVSPEAMGVIENASRPAGQIGWVMEKTEVVIPGVTVSHCTFIHLGRCDTCNTLHDPEATCPYCAGHEDGAAEADGSRRALEFATQQQMMLAGQLAKRDDIITDLRAKREDLLSECADLRTKVQLAAQNFERQRDLKLLWIDRYHDLAETQANARSFLRRLGAGLTLLGGGGLLACLCWDALPSLGHQWNVWAGIAVGLGALLVLRRPVRSVDCNGDSLCTGCGRTLKSTWRHPKCLDCDPKPYPNIELPGGNPGTYGPDSGTAHRLGPSG